MLGSIQSVQFDASTDPQYIPSDVTTTGVRLYGIVFQPSVGSSGLVTRNLIKFSDNSSGDILFSFKRSPVDGESPNESYFIPIPSNGIRFPGGIKVEWVATDDFSSITVLYQV